MELEEREANILEIIIRDYIHYACPVSSQRVLECKSLPWSPATIRSTMAELENGGYLSQPHTSAGRVPTQKGYRFFVDNIMEDTILPRHFTEQLRRAKELRKRLKTIAEGTHLLALGYHEDTHTLVTFGMEQLLQEPEFADQHRVRQLGTLLDTLSEAIEEYEEKVEDKKNILVFIEEENPVPEARFASVVATTCDNGAGLLLTIGPSRMNYSLAASVLKSSSSFPFSL